MQTMESCSSQEGQFFWSWWGSVCNSEESAKCWSSWESHSWLHSGWVSAPSAVWLPTQTMGRVSCDIQQPPSQIMYIHVCMLISIACTCVNQVLTCLILAYEW